jgi:hypothetical protein
VQVELLDSPLTTGSDTCRRLIHLRPPASTLGLSNEERARASKKAHDKPRKKQGSRKASR